MKFMLRLASKYQLHNLYNLGYYWLQRSELQSVPPDNSFACTPYQHSRLTHMYQLHNLYSLQWQ